MQIKRITLYKSPNEVRDLELQTGAVNIITGESKTGKTALIDIVDYCMGTTGCPIADGVKEKNVQWFSVTFEFEDEQIFVARRNPYAIDQESTSEVHISIGSQLTRPSFDSLRSNNNLDGLRSILARKLGISENTHTPENFTRDPLKISVKHSRVFCFQPQDTIAQRGHLFYHQTEEFVPQAIRDTFPYLLGAVREDTLALEQELAVKQREMRRLMRIKKDAEKMTFKVRNQALELIEEAKELGLIDSDVNIETSGQAILELRTVLGWSGEENDVSGLNDTLNLQIARKRELKAELGKLNEDIAVAEKYADEAEGFTDEIRSQQRRLSSIGIFESKKNNDPNDTKDCPLCGSELNEEIPGVNSLNEALSKLNDSLISTTQERPRLRNYIEKLFNERAELKEEIRTINRVISGVYQQQTELRNTRDLNIRRGKIIGRIELFLESVDLTDSSSHDSYKITQLESSIRNLEAAIGIDEKEQRLDSILYRINLQMSNWANLVDFEQPDVPLRFDPKRLNLFADKPTRTVPLNLMGSGANWLSGHLVVHMALHNHFITSNRPIPRFIFLDQPSQIYYPPKYEELPGQYQASNDDAMVKRMYDFVSGVLTDLAPNFQIIITDHARLPEYKDSIVEEWRNGMKLIPESWYT